MPVVSDILFGKYALQQGWVSSDILQGCMAEQSQLQGSGQSCSLADLMAHRGYVDTGRAQQLIGQIAQLNFHCQNCQAPFTYQQMACQAGIFCLYCRNPLNIQQGDSGYQPTPGPAACAVTPPAYVLSDSSAPGQFPFSGPDQPPTMGSKPASPGGTQIIYSSNRNGIPKKDTRFDSSKFKSQKSGGKIVGSSGLLQTIDGRKYIGDFEVIDELGRGAMGVVYRVRVPQTGQVVALKLLIAGGLASETAIKRFIREAEITARLEHPVIVPIHDFGSIDGHPFFTMQFVDGQPLSTLIKLRKIGLRKAVMIARDLARGLHYAHSQKVIHRDIKPANILIDSDKRPHLTDFGLARDIGDEENKRLTRSGAVIGTPYYMAPEQVEGSKDVGSPCDIYALGIVLFQMLTFQLPFIAKSQIELSRMILSDLPPKPSTLESSIDNKLNAITLKALAKKPSQRYSSAADMAADLDAYLSGESVMARGRPNASKLPKYLGVVTGMLALVALGVGLTIFVLGPQNNNPGPQISLRPDPQPQIQPVIGPKPGEKVKAERALKSAIEKIHEAQTAADPELYSPLLKEAINDLTLALSLDESLSKALVLRGVAHALLSETDQAEQDLTAAGNHPMALFYLSKVKSANELDDSTKQKSMADVLHLMSQASRMPGDSPYIRLAKFFVVAFKNKEPDVALLMLDPMLTQYPDHNADIYLLKGYVQLKLKREDAALLSFNNVLRIYPNSKAALSNRCQLLLALKDYNSAIRDAQRLTKIDSNSPSAYAVLGQIHAVQGERPQAIRQIRRYLELKPQDYGARLLYADLLSRENKFNAAVTECRKVLRGDPQSVRGYRILAKIYKKHGRPTDSDKMFEEAIKTIKEPNTQWRLFEELIKSLLNRKRLAEIDRLCRARMKSHPHEDMAFVLLGQTYYLTGKAADGLDLLREATRIAPKSYSANKGMITGLLEAGKVDEVEDAIKSMLARAPESAHLLTLASEVAAQLGDSTASLNYLKEALAIEPGHSKAKLQLATMYLARLEHSEMERLVGELIAEEKTPRSVIAKSRTLLASSYAQRDRIQEATEEATKAIRLDPDNPSPRGMLARIYFNAKRLDYAYQLCKDSIKRGAINADIWDMLGRIELYEKKNLREAAKAFKSVLKIRKKDPVAYYFYALTLHRMGDAAGARTCANQGLALDPDFAPLKTLVAKFKNP
jgi:tetratricopeptide (TPR) repeat protein